VLSQTLVERIPLAMLSLKAKADTAGTTITPVDIFPAASVSGPGGSVLAEAGGITLGTESEGQAEKTIFLPVIMKE